MSPAVVMLPPWCCWSPAAAAAWGQDRKCVPVSPPGLLPCPHCSRALQQPCSVLLCLLQEMEPAPVEQAPAPKRAPDPLPGSARASLLPEHSCREGSWPPEHRDRPRTERCSVGESPHIRKGNIHQPSELRTWQ